MPSLTTCLPEIFMYQPVTYDKEFPPLVLKVDTNYTSQPFIKNPTTVDVKGRPKRVTPAKAVLNWQTINASTPNKVLKKVEARVYEITE